jgi:Tfp pilus assembly protein PilF
MSTFNEADRISPNNADIKHHIGRTYYQLDNPIKAIELYLESLALDPTKTDVHNNLGIVYMTQREYEKARREFQYCIEDITYGNAEMSRYNMGLLEENLNNPDKAVPYYMHVISSGGNMAPSAYYRMAYMAFKKADYRSSVDYLTAAVRLNSEYPDAFFLMGESFEKLGFEDEAAEAYGRCVTLDSTSIRGIEAQKRIRAIMHEYK